MAEFVHRILQLADLLHYLLGLFCIIPESIVCDLNPQIIQLGLGAGNLQHIPKLLELGAISNKLYSYLIQ